MGFLDLPLKYPTIYPYFIYSNQNNYPPQPTATRYPINYLPICFPMFDYHLVSANFYQHFECFINVFMFLLIVLFLLIFIIKMISFILFYLLRYYLELFHDFDDHLLFILIYHLYMALFLIYCLFFLFYVPIISFSYFLCIF